MQIQPYLFFNGRCDEAIDFYCKALGAECHITGDTVRAVLPESQQDAAIDALRRERIRLIAITPLRTSLEAYFVEKLQTSQTTAGATS